MATDYREHLREVLRKRTGGERRLEILDATSLMVIERGFEQTRYSDIAASSGVSVGTLQNYFGSLENLLIEACLHTCDTDFAQTRDIALAIDDAWERLLWVVKLLMACDRPGPGWQVRIEFWHAAIFRSYLREEVSRMQTEWRALIVDALHYGQAAAVFTPTRDVHQIALHIASTCEGTVFPVWMNNPDFDVRAFESYVVEDLSLTLHSHPTGFTTLDAIERKYRNSSPHAAGGGGER
jgi:AcrR family transcriptional regulator